MTSKQDWAEIGPVSVRRRGRLPVAFETIEAAVAWAGWPYVADYRDEAPFVDDLREGWSPTVDPVDILFADELGMRIPTWRVMLAARETRLEYRWLNRHHAWVRHRYDPSTFRKAPVPGVGPFRGRRYRRPKLAQERRTAEAVTVEREYVEAGGRLRARRNAGNLSYVWDESIRGERGKTWKSTRPHQWRG